MFNRAL